MPTTKSLLREYFEQLAGLPCWNVKAEYGSWLSLNFGTPHLETREGNPDAKIGSLKRRAVFVTGEFRVWVEMGAWEILENGKRIYHSDQSRAYLRRAASRLDSQKISVVALLGDEKTTVFSFDQGSQLHVRSVETADADEGQWHVYCHGNCLTLLANWTLEYGPSKGTKRRQITANAAIYAA